MRTFKTWAPTLVAAAALVACFGGGGDDIPAPAPLTISGTAAKGSALAGAKVDIKCATGRGTATAAGTGAYTLTLDSASRPCAIKATGTEGSVFHSVASGSGGGSVTANVTPLTEMMVAKIASAAPGSYFAGFGAGSTLAETSLTQAVDYLKTALAGVTDLGAVNPVTSALAVGDAHDQKIEATMARLATAGLGLGTVTAAIAANPDAPSVIAGPIAPAAAECAWFKSGKYRLIDPFESDPAQRVTLVEVDAVAKTAKNPDGSTFAFGSNGACQFIADTAEDVVRILVSQASVLVIHHQFKPTGQYDAYLALPEQTLPLTEVAGNWNYALWGPLGPGSYVAAAGEMTIDSAGNVTAFTACLGMSPCAVMPQPYPKIAANATLGGFDVSLGGLPAGRAFGFKTLDGKLAFVSVEGDGSVLVGMRRESLGALPAVGTVNHFGSVSYLSNGSVYPTLVEDSTTVIATDATARTVTRLRSSSQRVDTLLIDRPRDGLRYRAPDSCTLGTIGGTPVACAEVVQMPMPGIGITLVHSVTTTSTGAFFEVSVNKPN